MNDAPFRRKLAPRPIVPRTTSRAIVAAPRSTWRLPTVAAVASAMAIVGSTSNATADETPWFDDAGPSGGSTIVVNGSVVVSPNGTVSATVSVSTGDAGTNVEDATPSDADPDASADAEKVYCDPSGDDRMLGGVPVSPIPRVHSTGCGCTGGDRDDDEPAMAVAAMAVLMLLLRRR